MKSTHEVTVSQLNSEIQGRDAANGELREKIEDLSAQLLLRKEELAKRRSEIQTLRSSLSDLLGQRAELITQIDELKSTHDSIVSDGCTPHITC
jgi:chromosome segregation ATPase